SLQRIRGSRQRRDGVPLEKRIVGGEYPTIIRLAGVVTLYLIWAELRIIDASIGLRRSIAYLRVLAQIWLVRAADRVANILKLRQDIQRAMPHLFHSIRHAVGAVHLHFARAFIHLKLVVVEIEFAISQRQALNYAKLRRLLYVEVAGVIPTTYVHAGNMVPAFILPVGGRSLIPAVKLLANHWRHAAIIEVRSAVPHM